MSKRIALWVCAFLMIGGVAAATYIYSNGGTASVTYHDASVSKCPITGVAASSVAAPVDSRATSCCKLQSKTDSQARAIDTSAYTAITRVGKSCGAEKAGLAKLQADGPCATNTSDAITVTQASR